MILIFFLYLMGSYECFPATALPISRDGCAHKGLPPFEKNSPVALGRSDSVSIAGTLDRFDDRQICRSGSGPARIVLSETVYRPHFPKGEGVAKAKASRPRANRF
jgi:hypothetical protein